MRIEREVAELADLQDVSELDLDEVRRGLEAKLADWRGLLGRHLQQARGILTKGLARRPVFTPHTDQATGTRSYWFEGEGRLEAVLPGVLQLPRALVTRAGFTRPIWTLPLDSTFRVAA